MRCSPALRSVVAIGTASVVALTGFVGGAPQSAVAAATTTVHGVTLNAFEARLLVDINRTRKAHHLKALTIAAGPTDVARNWSWHIASTKTLAHNPSLLSDLTKSGSLTWNYIEENVGFGPVASPDLLFQAYMHSPPHRANILGKKVRYIGIGAVQHGASVWNTIDFVNKYSASYGPTRTPADGLSSHTTPVASTTMLASAAHLDQRFGAIATSGVKASRVHCTGGAATAGLSDLVSLGHGGIVFRDEFSMTHVSALQVRLGAVGRTGLPVPVGVSVGNGWTTHALGGVLVSSPGVVTIPVPASARKLTNTVTFAVSGAGITAAGGHVTLSVADLTAVVN